MNWAFSQEIEPKYKIILLALADWADGDGVSFPGQKSLSEKTSIPERTLRRLIHDLEEMGLIQRQRRTLPNGQRTSDEYRLVALPAKMAGYTTGHSGGGNRPTVAATRNHQIEPSVNKKRATPLPDDWEPSNAHSLQAHSKGVDVHYEAEKFRDWCLANDTRKVDWEATFRNWIRNARPGGAVVQGSFQPPIPITPTDRMNAILAIQDPRETRRTQ